MVDLMGGQLERSSEPSAPQSEPPPLPPFTRSVHASRCPLCAATCFGYSPAWLWPGLGRFRREPAGLQGPLLLIRRCTSAPDTSPRGHHSALSSMIYNPFQGITAANGLSQFALPKRGGQNQLMESRTWPGLMAECGLTSGSDKGDWRKKKKNTAPPPPRSISRTVGRGCRANRAAGHGPLSV